MYILTCLMFDVGAGVCAKFPQRPQVPLLSENEVLVHEGLCDDDALVVFLSVVDKKGRVANVTKLYRN